MDRSTWGKTGTCALLLAAMLLGGALAVRAEDGDLGEDIPVRGTACELLAEHAFRITCPPKQIPEREDPWLPVIKLPDPEEEPGCEQLVVVVDNIEVTRCPTLGPGGVTLVLDSPAARAPGIAVVAEPDYGGPSDILPFQLCFDRDAWPESITLEGPSAEEYVTAARVRAYCCATCG